MSGEKIKVTGCNDCPFNRIMECTYLDIYLYEHFLNNYNTMPGDCPLLKNHITIEWDERRK